MQIVHVIQTLDPVHGGPPVTAVRLACAQAMLGHSVHIVSYIYEDESKIRKSLHGIPGVERVQLTILAKPSLLEKLFGWKANKIIYKLLESTQMVHLHGVWDTIVRVGAIAACRRSIPYFLTPHGMLDSWSMRQSAFKKRIALALFYRKVVNRASCIHVLNSTEAKLLEPVRVIPPFRIIPNGVFLEEIDGPAPDPSELIGRYRFLGSPYIVFLSRLHYKKGLDYLADSFALLCKSNSEVQLVVAGPDYGAQREFETNIARHNLTERVHLVGPIYGAVKYSLLRSASCFCLPSRQEGFSIAILEALACALPVVISENCHFPEVGTEGAGIVTQLRAEDLAKALKTIVEDRDTCQRMALAGRRLVEDRYSWERVAERCLSAYEEFVHP